MQIEILNSVVPTGNQDTLPCQKLCICHSNVNFAKILLFSILDA